jgi:hypothetical protein
MKRQVLLFSTMTLLVSFAAVIAGVPQLITYQGRLTTTAGTPLTTTVSLTFTIYDDSLAGNVKWTETQPSVVVTDGLFAVTLGSIETLVDTVFSAPDRFLGIAVGADPEIAPRTRIVSIAYAYQVGSINGASGGTVTGPLEITAPDEGRSAQQPEHAGTPMLAVGAGVTIGASGAIDGTMHLLNSTGDPSIDMDAEDTTVGIGTELPQANLHVNGDIYVLGGTGDVDGNGTVNVSDATPLINYLAKLSSLTPKQLANGDMDGDARVTYDDLTILFHFLYGGMSKTDAIRRVHATYGASPDVVNAPDAFYIPGSVGIGTSNPQEKVQIIWSPGVDAELGRGTTDPNITYIGLRNTNGNKCYIYPDAAGTGIVVSTTKP